YHGDTFAAMSVTDPDNSMHSLYKGFLPEHIFAQSPQTGFWDDWDETDLADFETKIEQHHHEIAAVILKPIVQGAGGMRIYHPNFLKGVRELCDKYGVLLILDEIATGFGRTGKMFACEHANIQPDMLGVGKARTDAYMTLSAT
ncbi:adenosylmethionine-8-amino-7-oxononanoate aminotransferase, partial [Vibrio xuii]